MKHFLFTLGVCCISVAALNGQNANLESAYTFGSASSDAGQAVVADATGNVHSAGNFSGTIDFDPGSGVVNLTPSGTSASYIQKLSPSGGFIWAKMFTSANSVSLDDIALDNSNNIVAIGRFNGTADFDPGSATFNLTANGLNDIYITKLDLNGDFLWARSIGGPLLNQANAVEVDGSGNIYLTGYFEDTVDFDPGVAVNAQFSNGASDIFILKLDANGNFLWVNTVGGVFDDVGSALSMDTAGNPVVAGYFIDTVDFDPGSATLSLASAGLQDVFIQKLDPSGNLIWARKSGGSQSDYCHGLSADVFGNITAVGSFEGTADFNPGSATTNLVAQGLSDVFIQQLDFNGNFKWARSMGGSFNDIAFGVVVGDAGDVYCTGIFESIADFDPSILTVDLTSNGLADIFVCRFDATGNLIWAKSAGGSASDNGVAIEEGMNDKVHVVGSFQGTVDFDPNPATFNITANALSDAFLWTLSQCNADNEIDVVRACGSFEWVNGITYTSDNNSAVFVLKNAAGCDSVLTLNLTIDTINTAVQIIDDRKLMALDSGVAYQWLNCDSGFTIVSGANGREFSPQMNGSYAVEVSSNSCLDTSNCFSVNLVGMEHYRASKMVVYPNPTKDVLTVELAQEVSEGVLRLRSIGGKLIFERPFNNLNESSKLTLNLDLNPGIYFLEFSAEGSTNTTKLVVQP